MDTANGAHSARNVSVADISRAENACLGIGYIAKIEKYVEKQVCRGISWGKVEEKRAGLAGSVFPPQAPPCDKAQESPIV